MKRKLLMIFILVNTLHAASHHPEAWLKSLDGREDKACQIYQTYCKNCHDSKPLIRLGAPRVGVADDWKGRKKILKNTLLGKGLMPARGGCFECSDETLQEVIDYMLKIRD